MCFNFFFSKLKIKSKYMSLFSFFLNLRIHTMILAFIPAVAFHLLRHLISVDTSSGDASGDTTSLQHLTFDALYSVKKNVKVDSKIDTLPLTSVYEIEIDVDLNFEARILLSCSSIYITVRFCASFSMIIL